ncbi:MAG: holo-ACP synthase [Burkholderiales bacterium]|nr:holo-ACP synthase [Burkholderiales bacterium]
MIYGIGVDVLEPARVARLLESYGERFARRVLTEEEWPAYQRSRRPALFIANRFAAKEAFSKAMGTGFRYPVTLGQISVIADKRGKPELYYSPDLQRMVESEGIGAGYVTISDEQSVVCAVVVLERR